MGKSHAILVAIYTSIRYLINNIAYLFILQWAECAVALMRVSSMNDLHVTHN